MSNSKDSDDMTPDERLAWLRERGIQIETPEDRRQQQVKEALPDANNLPQEEISFVHVPHDTSKPLREMSFSIPKEYSNASGDLLADYLQPVFGGSGKDVDLSLFREQAAQHLGSVDSPGEVSEASLNGVASQGSVETFALVHAMPSNKFTGVNIYLDEVGMLKRLPLNSRASDYASRAGFSPPPQFYGDVYIGRVKTKPVLRNVSFKHGVDTATDAPWLQQATMENLEYQTAMNRITGRNETQPSVDGEGGVAKAEDGYSWTQTEEELEIVVSLAKDATSKDVAVKYLPKSIQIKFRNNEVLKLDLFERVDPDGCNWTLDRDDKTGERKLLVTLEKSDAALWPRITH